MNISEQEKNRIRGLHLVESKDNRITSVLNEQKTPNIPTDAPEFQELLQKNNMTQEEWRDSKWNPKNWIDLPEIEYPETPEWWKDSEWNPHNWVSEETKNTPWEDSPYNPANWFNWLNEQDAVKGREETAKIQGISTNLLTPAVQRYLSGKKATTIDMLKIMAGCYVHGKHGASWAGLGPGGWDNVSRKTFPLIYPKVRGKAENALIGQMKSGWAEEINPCKMYKVPEGWRRSDFLVPAIVNFWNKMATSVSNSPITDDNEPEHGSKRFHKMQSLGDRFTWVPDRDNGVNTKWTLTKK